MEAQQNSKGFVDSEVNLIKTEQKTINYDISRVEDHIQQVRKPEKSKKYTFGLVLVLASWD